MLILTYRIWFKIVTLYVQHVTRTAWIDFDYNWTLNTEHQVCLVTMKVSWFNDSLQHYSLANDKNGQNVLFKKTPLKVYVNCIWTYTYI